MGLQDYISESEAAGRAGVSARTLQRFSESGYLHVEIEPDGLRLYSKAELDDIFGSHQGPPSVSVEARATELNPKDMNSKPVEPDADSVRTESDADSAVGKTEATEVAFSESVAEAPDYPVEPPPVAATRPSPVVAPTPESGGDSAATKLETELARLKRELETREDLLAARDAQLRDLRGQRDWLQTRVERLEEKSERDQILLLSETQTIRKLIAIQEKRRSPVRQVLEWLGIVQPPTPVVPVLGTSSPSKAQSMVVRKAANDR